MLTITSKNSGANGSERASAWIGNTPSSTPASWIRCWFSAALNQRSVAQTCTPNSRRRKIDDDARPQPRSSTLIPGRRSIALVSHSVSHSALAPPLAFASTQSGWYFEERGKRSEMSRVSVVTLRSIPIFRDVHQTPDGLPFSFELRSLGLAAPIVAIDSQFF